MWIRFSGLGALFLSLSMSSTVSAEDKTTFELDTSHSTTEVKVGAEGKIALHIKPADGYKVNEKGPLKVSVQAPDGLSVPKSTMGRTDASGKATSPEFQCTFEATAAGTKPVMVQATFVLCDTAGTICEMKREKVQLAVKVEK